MRGEWVTPKEAAKVLGRSVSTVHQIARRKGWESRLVPRTCKPCGRPNKMFRRDAVQKYVAQKAKRKLRSCKISKRYSFISELVDWADGLKAWPPDDEIMDRTTLRYKYHDIVSVLENRSEREEDEDGNPYKWIGRPEGDGHDDQSSKLQATLGVGASH